MQGLNSQVWISPTNNENTTVFSVLSNMNWATHPPIQSVCAASWETDWLRTAISILITGFDFSIEWVDHCTSTPVFCPLCVISTPESEKYRHRISFINSNTKKNKLVKIAKLKTNIINQADILEHIETFIPPKKNYDIPVNMMNFWIWHWSNHLFS